MRKWMIITWLGILCLSVVALFWRNEWIYALPTPVPQNYKSVDTGTSMALPVHLAAQDKKPVFLHFFNPSCPCSRFNIKHFKSLVKQYGDAVHFYVVLMTNKDYTEKDIQQRFDLTLPVIKDTSLATTCGVYSTPQAVIINQNNKLYYRGNYNKSRYCTDKNTNYAQIALEALLHNQPNIHFNQFALTAYGCQLPVCEK